MNPVALSDSVYIHFGTTRVNTGAATNADSLPVVVVAEDGVDMAYTPSVANVTTGLYIVTIVASAANGFEAGKRYSLYATATVNSITGRDGIGEFEVLANDLNVIAATVWDEVLTKSTHDIANSAGKIVRQLRGMTIHEGTAQAGGLNTVTLDTGASATDHIYKECLIVIIAGTAAGEAHHILSYNGATKVAVVDQNWYVQPDNTSDFIMFGSSAHDTIETGVAQAATTTSITLNGTAATTDDLYNDQMVFISSGTGTGQVRRITDYVGVTKVATVDKAWAVTPDSTSGYMLYPAVDNALAVRTNLAAEVIDGAITRIEKERAELAETLGHGTVPAGAGTYAFKAQDGTTTRIGGTVDANGVRTVTTVNGSP